MNPPTSPESMHTPVAEESSSMGRSPRYLVVELPIDTLPSAYEQGEFDFGASCELDVPSRDLVPLGEIVVGELVDDSEIKSPEQIIAEQKELTREILKATAAEHQRLREWQGRLWEELAGRLKEFPIHDVSKDRFGNFVVEWHMDVHDEEPKLAVDRNNRPVGSYVTVTMNSRDLNNVPQEDQQMWQEAWRAMAELHGDEKDGVPAKERKETALLGKKSRKVRGAYVYDRAALACKLGEALPRWATKVKVTPHTVKEDTYDPKKEPVEVGAPNYWEAKLPEKLEEVFNNPDSEWADRIVDVALEDLRWRAQSRTGDWDNKLAFPDNSKDIEEAMLHKYLLFPTVEAEQLNRANEILASRKLIPRTIRDVLELARK